MLKKDKIILIEQKLVSIEAETSKISAIDKLLSTQIAICNERHSKSGVVVYRI
ncbi:MAG: hypothetical protein J4473_01480 [Candidatus Aenigmarchaeota archaeon]|nr:hypothetical protein [Candidatus Aenigmarchaeota archaeon]